MAPGFQFRYLCAAVLLSATGFGVWYVTYVQASTESEPNHISPFVGHQIQLRLPNWLSCKAWDFLWSTSYSGFQFTMNVYSIVPDHAPAFIFAKTGDLMGLQDLFEKRLASPFDRTPGGKTLLHVCFFHLLYVYRPKEKNLYLSRFRRASGLGIPR